MKDLKQSLSLETGVGIKKFEYFKNAGIYTLEDLIFTYPKKYVVYELTTLNDLLDGKKGSVEAIIDSFIFTKKIKKCETIFFYIKIEDKKILAIGFGKGYLKYSLKKNMKIIINGNYHENEKKFLFDEVFLDNFIEKIVKDYKIKDINNSLIDSILLHSINEVRINETLPSYLIEKYRLLDINKLIALAHFPRNRNDLKQVERRIKYEGYLNYALCLNLLKDSVEAIHKKPKLFDENFILDFIKNLPFKLTISQEECLKEIEADTKSDKIMSRLVQGDVGSGKTILCIIASLMQINLGYQVVLLCPTEILANQHFETFKKFLVSYNIRIRLLTSSLKESEKKDVLSSIENDKVDILIGTHALFYHKLKFKSLGLVIIDEQHRFGVNDRAKLMNDNKGVDAIYLSATPIPRTLGITKFGDLSLSSLKLKPSGRKEIKTLLLEQDKFKEIVPFIDAEIEKGHQIFMVCASISDSSDLLNVDDALELVKNYFPNRRALKIHGKMKAQDKKEIMLDFLNQKADILISTTVIEVGIDIKNATTMVIFNSERFGLSTLHQLRGRIGRNDLDSYCILLSKNKDIERLNILKNTSDCFTLAEEDLKLRGPGDILGSMQSGFPLENLYQDIKIYECALKDSLELILKSKKEKIEIVEKAKLKNSYNLNILN